MQSSADFPESYQRASELLKRGIFRRPNYPEATQQFEALRNSFRQDGSDHYAAFCSVAVARCEEAMGHKAKEAATYVEAVGNNVYFYAGNIFLRAEVETMNLNYLGFQEYVTDAISCYLHAVEIYKSMKPSRTSFVASLYRELASSLRVLNVVGDAKNYFVQAAEVYLKERAVTSALACWEDAYECALTDKEYENGREILQQMWTEIVRLPMGDARDQETAGLATWKTTSAIKTAVGLCVHFAVEKNYSEALIHLKKVEVFPGPGLIDEDLIPTLEAFISSLANRDLPAAEEVQTELQWHVTAEQYDLTTVCLTQLRQECLL